VDRVVTAASFFALPEPELAVRACRLRLVLSDCDGVLTDGTVYYSAHGEELKRFSLRDGMGFERLRDLGIEGAIITRERSPIVERRAEKLGLQLYQGVRDKSPALEAILKERGLQLGEIGYIGDDVNDLGPIELLAASGLTAAPSDAAPEVRGAAHIRCSRPGGAGAFREFAEVILELRGRLGRSNTWASA
jgi:3-deoxy-D-manno-octulosonate 8-phosphate phosphatase (KDO 8-P phosphatase)